MELSDSESEKSESEEETDINEEETPLLTNGSKPIVEWFKSDTIQREFERRVKAFSDTNRNSRGFSRFSFMQIRGVGTVYCQKAFNIGDHIGSIRVSQIEYL